MSKTLFMMRGLPASGKSTRAKQMLKDFGTGNAKRVNKDELRILLDDGHWSGPNEKFLIGVRDHIIISALNAGKHVIVDDTNLAPKHQARLRELALLGGASFEIVDFSHVGVDECIERDRKRPNYVGEKVIRGMWDQFLRPKRGAAPADPWLPSCLIVDVDGTVAQMNGRGPFEWSRVGEDLPRRPIIRAVLAYGVPWIFMSGRDECCRAATEEWLTQYFGAPGPLHMRPAGDSRKDAIVKRELYEAHIQGKYNVEAIFDDRPQMIREWQALGFADRIFNVGDGTEF